MRPTLVAIVALVGFAGLAGCAEEQAGGPPTTSTPTGSQSGSGTTGPPAPPPPVLQLLSFELAGCRGLSVRHTRPLDDVQRLLPGGFTAAPAPGAVHDATGALAVDVYQCASLSTLTATVPDTYVGIVYTYVERPTERVPGAPDAPVQEYVFRMLAGEDVLAQLWKAAQYDTYNGSAEVQTHTVPGVEPLRANLAFVGTDYIVSAGGADVGALGGDRDQAFARYSVVEADGSILLWTGTYDMPAAAMGPGSFQVAADDPIASAGTPGRPTFAGTATQVDDGAMRGLALSRVFT